MPLAALTLATMAGAQVGEPFCATRNSNSDGNPITLSFQGTTQHFGGTVEVVRDGGWDDENDDYDRAPTAEVPDEVLEGVTKASTRVNSKCQSSAYVPQFSENLSVQRPVFPGDSERFTQLGISYDPNSGMPNSIINGLRRWTMAEFVTDVAGGSNPVSTVTLYGKCPRDFNRALCHKVPGEGWKIDWSLSANQDVITHEILHGLGLGHDSEAGACEDERGLMQADSIGGAPFRYDYCSYANHLNCIGDNCPKDPRACADSGGSGPDCYPADPEIPFDLHCEINPTSPLCGDPNNPNGGGPTCSLTCTCVEVQEGEPPTNGGGTTLCVDDPFAGALGCNLFPGLIVSPGTPTKMVHNNCPLSATDCDGTIRYYWDCDFPPSQDPLRTSGAGSGPGVTVISPWHGDTVSGVIPVHLSVDEASFSGTAVAYLVDGEVVTLADSFGGASTEGFCDLAHIADPRCPSIGFGGMLDTRQFPDGVHVLQVLAERNDPNLPFYTFAQVEFEIRNQTQPPQPEIVMAEGWGGHTRIPNDGTYGYSFGERHVDTFPFVAPFLICNIGNANLDLLNHGTMVTGSGFSRESGSPASFVEPMRCSQLNVRFDVDTPGTYVGTVSIAGNDPDDDPFTFQISGMAIGSGNRPQLVLREVVNGVETSHEYANGELVDLGDTPATLGLSRVYSIRNLGTESLTINNLSLAGACYFTGWSHDGVVIPVQGSIWFNTTFTCLAVDQPLGAYPGNLTIRGSDPSADSFTLQLHADLVANANPRLWVRRMAGGIPGDYVWNGATVAFPSTPVGQPTSILFEIKNLSNSASLVIANPATLVSGTCFTQIGTAPVAVVAPLASTSFRVRLMCGSPGPWAGTVSIQSNDPNWPGPGTLQFNVTGTVTP